RILGLAASCTVFIDVPHLKDLQDDPSRINHAGMPDIFDSPGFHGFGQFSTHPPPFVEQRPPCFEEWRRQAEEPVQGSNRPRCDDEISGSKRTRIDMFGSILDNLNTDL